METIKNLKICGSFEDFRNVYLEFRGYPFFEDWKEKDIKEEYEYYMDTADVFAKLDKNKVVGILALQEGLQKGIVFPTENVGYISDVAVLQKYRGKGYGTELMQFALDKFISEGKDLSYFRTGSVNSMSAPIGLKQGYELLLDKDGKPFKQMVSFPRVREDIPEEEDRVFYVKKLK